MTRPPAAEPRPQGRERWRIATAPQTLLAAFALVWALGYALHALTRPAVPAPPTLPALAGEVGETVTREVRYVVVDALGLERPAFADVPLPRARADDPGTRLAAALAALRGDLLAVGAWPPSVGSPAAFVFELERRVIAVIDVATPSAGEIVDVPAELAAWRSLVATARVEVDADEVRITVAGQPAPSLWGQVAVHPDRF